MSDPRNMMRHFEALPYSERDKVMAHVRARASRSWKHATIEGLGFLWMLLCLVLFFRTFDGGAIRLWAAVGALSAAVLLFAGQVARSRHVQGEFDAVLRECGDEAGLRHLVDSIDDLTNPDNPFNEIKDLPYETRWELIRRARKRAARDPALRKWRVVWVGYFLLLAVGVVVNVKTGGHRGDWWFLPYVLYAAPAILAPMQGRDHHAAVRRELRRILVDGQF